MAILGELAALLLLPLFLAFLLARKISKKQDRPKPKLPPGPPGLPIIGNLHQLGENSHQTLCRLSKKYGPLMHMQLGRVPALVISSAQLAEQVLKTHDLLFCSRPATTAWKRLSYNFSDVAFSPYNATWRELRKIILHNLLNPKTVEGFRDAREEEAERMIGSISHRSSLSQPINLSSSLLSFSNNLICRVAFGRRFQSEEPVGDQKSGFHEVLLESEALFMAFFASDYFSYAGWVDVLSGVRSRLEKNFIELDNFYGKIIAAHEDPIRAEEKEDVVDVLLHHQKEEKHLIEDQVKGLLMDILHAGTNTTFATLEYAMAELMKNPSVMLKAQEEVRRIVGDKGRVEDCDVPQMSYLKMVVKETLRLHPVVPLLLPREVMGHVKINEYDVFPKTRVFVNVWAIGRDPDSWDKPDEFIPERFVGSDVDFSGHNYQFLPFGAGRRMCPGLSFAIKSVELALANLLYTFNWELPDNLKKEGIDMKEVLGISVHLKTNLQLQATRHVPYVRRQMVY
ncbi:hypothetical protein Taro_049333 [Colocasia esculenta]|uniref:Cytochrome P450 71A1 n=1 Tax=Colocasia esculenta TaxID=4460 RepID=A0A843XAM8_COLES|nr:hypothetical protein [Colocasia esculenta]